MTRQITACLVTLISPAMARRSWGKIGAYRSRSTGQGVMSTASLLSGWAQLGGQAPLQLPLGGCGIRVCCVRPSQQAATHVRPARLHAPPGPAIVFCGGLQHEVVGRAAQVRGKGRQAQMLLERPDWPLWQQQGGTTRAVARARKGHSALAVYMKSYSSSWPTPSYT